MLIRLYNFLLNFISNIVGKILVFIGTNEVFYPDCLILEEKAKKLKNTSVKLIIEKDFILDRLFSPFPKKARTYKQIKNFIEEVI
ncbi:MAG TPA: hypothetical protein PLF21_05475 [Exilispira sp.]|nr:hypothetical protein [Exilispira sp.]